jgi:regulator of protease activity HflC (stomatin/prohibitin superfamily)
MEKEYRAISGITMAVVALALLITGILMIVNMQTDALGQPAIGYLLLIMLCFAAVVFILKGMIIVDPNFAVVITFLGKYLGTTRQNGLLFIIPFYGRQKVNLRMQSLETKLLKVNDKMGNPIEIASVILWQIKDTYKVVFDVVSFSQYLSNQSDAAVRHIASAYSYDINEDENASITLRDGGEVLMNQLEKELNERLLKAGIEITEARISHLAYSPEIAGAMLQRQQATAIVAARTKIVEGAVGMVETALEMLSKKQIVNLDEERKAVMVSNLMVVLCGEKAATPVLNTGTLYQ